VPPSSLSSPGRRLAVAAVLAYAVLAVLAVGALLWSGLAPAQRRSVGDVVAGSAAVLAIGGALALTGLGALVARLLGPYASVARRLAADARVIADANPDHRLRPEGPAELADLAAAVNELAERRSCAEREVTEQVAAAQAGLEQERNRLATLMAELSVAVLVCTVDGRILLYNAAARALVGDDAAVGLGRSVYGVVDRGLVAHALERILERTQEGPAQAQVATALRGQQVLQVRLAGVHAPDGELTGLVLVLEDLTSRLRAIDRREALLRGLTEATRASLGSIQAAIEAMLDYPDMDAAERRQFAEIVREESRRLGGEVQRWVEESAGHLGAEELLTDLSGADLLALLQRAIEREELAAVTAEPVAGELWVKADSHALTRALVHLVARVQEETGAAALRLALARAGRHGQLDVRWAGPVPPADVVQSWLDEPPSGGSAASVREVLERHGAEAWCARLRDRGEPQEEQPESLAYLRVLLPVTDPASLPSAPRNGGTAGSRPEFYDFALFDQQEQLLDWADRRLSELAFTVFDTETTGLDPAGGDEIISIGAVRVVNGRLLRNETFAQLVDPQRPVSPASTAVHGLSAADLAGSPTIDTVLPAFARYAEDTVLVGHNVGFDLQFLRLKEERTGVRFPQPVLDTLLLDAALHPDHEEHSLEAIAARLGVTVTDRHTALGDALVTGEVFLGILRLLDQRGIRTVGAAVEAARATYHARLDSAMYGQREK
jgi:DNA polymerase III subunit epsilon